MACLLLCQNLDMHWCLLCEVKGIFDLALFTKGYWNWDAVWKCGLNSFIFLNGSVLVVSNVTESIIQKYACISKDFDIFAQKLPHTLYTDTKTPEIGGDCIQESSLILTTSLATSLRTSLDSRIVIHIYCNPSAANAHLIGGDCWFFKQTVESKMMPTEDVKNPSWNDRCTPSQVVMIDSKKA